MIEKLTKVTLFVTDQDEAVEFYTTKLGFVKQADHQYRDGSRYLAVGLLGQEISLVLWKGTAAVRDAVVGGTGGAWVLSASDVAQEYRRLAAHGVTFEQDRPQQAPGAL
jgi:catechol 2,3-dioxygenase-like lactoylglutathione lyase family enzyme